MRRFLIIAAMAIALAVAVAAGGTGPTPEDVWSQYVVAQKRFQLDTFELLRAKWRDLEETLRLHRDQQLAVISMRDLKFRWLLEHAADRIVVDEGLSAFANFRWSEAETDSLRRARPRYAELEAFLDATNRRLEADSLLADARERMLTLSADRGYLQLSSRFRNRLHHLEAELARTGLTARPRQR